METKVTKTEIIISGYFRKDKFKIVEDFPHGAIVWNIGRRNFPFEGFVPVGFPLSNDRININKLFAVRCKDEKTAVRVINYASRHEVNKDRFEQLIAPLEV